MNNFRPKVNFPKTGIEVAADIIGIGALLLSLVFTLLNWGGIPQEIPAHFDFEGNVDRYGAKVELFILPIIAVALLILMQLVEKKPWLYNYPDRLNEENVVRFYTEGRKMMNFTKNLVNILFASISVQSVRIALGDIDSLSSGLLIGIIVAMVIVIFYGMIRMMKIKE